MKLSDLVAYRALLDEYHPRDSELRLSQVVDPIRHVVINHEIAYPDLQSTLNECRDMLSADLVRYETILQDIRLRVQQEIDSLEHQYLTSSYKLYDEEMCYDSVELILNRRPKLTDEAEAYLTGRIRMKTDWKRAGLIIRPGLERWVEDLVALDPLYIVDTDHNLLQPALDRFNPVYRRRVRPYAIKETDDLVLEKLPNEQIGFCLVYNFFNYKPFEIVRNYLEEIYEKLTPGGVLAMTINDCDRTGGVQLAERNFMCYTPGGMVKNLARSMGYIVSTTYEIDGATTWIEFVKSGYRPSIKGGQAILTLHLTPYSNEHRRQLVEHATRLEININESATAQEIEKLILQKQEELKLAPIREAEARRLEAEEERRQRETARIQQEKEQQRLEHIRKRQQLEENLQNKNIRETLLTRARDLNISNTEEMSNQELQQLTSEQMNELNRLRKEAVRLKIDATERILREYTLKQLKTAIKQWRKNNERPLT
jgi:SAM-dependent methyltransferase